MLLSGGEVGESDGEEESSGGGSEAEEPALVSAESASPVEGEVCSEHPTSISTMAARDAVSETVAACRRTMSASWVGLGQTHRRAP